MSNEGTQPPPVIVPKGLPLSRCGDIEFLRNATEKLWQILDDIDTASDWAKADDAAYRRVVERKQRKRFEVLTSDGYGLFLPLAQQGENRE